MMNKILAGRFSDGINYLNFLKGFDFIYKIVPIYSLILKLLLKLNESCHMFIPHVSHTYKHVPGFCILYKTPRPYRIRNSAK